MSFDQIAALTVLGVVVAALIHGKLRADIVALAGAAALLATGVVRPVEAQAAFASPAILASLPCSSSPTPWSCRDCWTH